MSTELEIQQTQARIAEVFARREQLKHALDSGTLPARLGFSQLETVDRELSELDSRFKALWDAAHSRTPAAGKARPA